LSILYCPLSKTSQVKKTGGRINEEIIVFHSSCNVIPFIKGCDAISMPLEMIAPIMGLPNLALTLNVELEITGLRKNDTGNTYSRMILASKTKAGLA
jgi:hypothetical protein